MGTDSAATFGTGTQFTIGQQAVKKLVKINDQILYCFTGAVGMSQIIVDAIQTLWSENKLKGKTADTMMNLVGQRIHQTVLPYLSSAHHQRAAVGSGGESAVCKSLIAMPAERRACLFQFDVNGAPERSTLELPFVAMGSGQAIADPFLALLKRLLWHQTEPTVAEGRMVAVWTIDHVRRTNPYGVGGDIQLATLEETVGQPLRVKIAGSDDVAEHLQRIASAEQALVAELRSTGVAEAVIAPPKLPTPSA